MILGFIFGSFATVAAYRIPRKESLGGRSKCPECGRMIPAWENIPVFGYLFLRGKCHGCGKRISIRYPLIELGTGLLFGLAAWKFGFTPEAFLYAALFWTLVVLSVIDLEHQLLPNRIIYPAFVVGWVGLIAAALADGEPHRLFTAAMGALIFGGFFFVVAFIVPAGMGMGDVKLGFVLGTFVGYLGAPGLVLLAMFLAFLTGGLIGIFTLLFRGGDRKTMLPFGPFLALGSVVAIFWGQRILDAYLGSV
ncbi:MAG: leader peptidase (prepilin peptidase) / N-methyltransferase [Actinomycetota bacterium]|nr:leader peptidase (prepilin peptidase) / N-methyltransferase [Actinomycetota bacterium]